MNLRGELADLSQRLSETAAAAAARQSDRCTPKFQGLDEGDDPRQKEIESMKSQVGPETSPPELRVPTVRGEPGVQMGGAGRGASRTSWR